VSLRSLARWAVWRVNLAIYGPPPKRPLLLKEIDDLADDWILRSPYVMGDDAWVCPRCDYPSWVQFGVLAVVKPTVCEECGWFKLGPLDLLAREG
jgi:hypothetical protein